MKILLDEKQNRYKANLHCHSNISDGKLTPAELKETYMRHGYSIIAYTDHDVLLAHDELTDDKFLALHGVELEVNEPGEFNNAKCVHMCFIAKKTDNMIQPCWHREWYLFGNAPKYRDLVQYDEALPNFVREYTPECINKMIKIAREKGFFVTYNHPNWSGEDATVYTKYTGMNAMEICNYGCVIGGWDDYNPQVYDDLLRKGEKIYCIAADDNHNHTAPESKTYDSFGGFTMIFADELKYETITDALSDGSFYASQGPEIYSLIYDADKVKIKCSNAERITYSTANRRRKTVVSEDGTGIVEAEFDVNKDDGYFRITVTDKYGKHANTNAYFVEDLAKE